MKHAILIILCFFSSFSLSAPATFTEAKTLLRQHVYHDQTGNGTLYCGCKWRWVGKSGGRIDWGSCGYQPRNEKSISFAQRLEWEHIDPASNFGRARQCWQNGGRDNCKKTDPVFNVMEADMFNLAPSIGEVNQDRKNFKYGQLPFSATQYGACPFKVDFKGRLAEPRDEVKGIVARATFYMHDRYNIRMSDQQQRLLMAWDKRFPVSSRERLIESRTAKIMGHHNEFITGDRVWSLGHKNAGDGVMGATQPRFKGASNPALTSKPYSGGGAVRGNRNSKIYHLPSGCPGYNSMSPSNVVSFSNELEALSRGFRKAKNCK